MQIFNYLLIKLKRCCLIILKIKTQKLNFCTLKLFYLYITIIKPIATKPNIKPTTNHKNGSPVVVFGFGFGVSVGGGGTFADICKRPNGRHPRFCTVCGFFVAVVPLEISTNVQTVDTRVFVLFAVFLWRWWLLGRFLYACSIQKHFNGRRYKRFSCTCFKS